MYSDSGAPLHSQKASELKSWISGSFKQSDLLRYVLLCVLLHRTPEHVIAVKQASSDSSKREALWILFLFVYSCFFKSLPDQSCCSWAWHPWGTKRRTARVRRERWCTWTPDQWVLSSRPPGWQVLNIRVTFGKNGIWVDMSERSWESDTMFLSIT